MPVYTVGSMGIKFRYDSEYCSLTVCRRSYKDANSTSHLLETESLLLNGDARFGLWHHVVAKAFSSQFSERDIS
jgi:hypothetical protein